MDVYLQSGLLHFRCTSLWQKWERSLSMVLTFIPPCKYQNVMPWNMYYRSRMSEQVKCKTNIILIFIYKGFLNKVFCLFLTVVFLQYTILFPVSDGTVNYWLSIAWSPVAAPLHVKELCSSAVRHKLSPSCPLTHRVVKAASRNFTGYLCVQGYNAMPEGKDKGRGKGTTNFWNFTNPF